MGIEDAAVLAELLSHALSAEDIPRLMRCYNQARHARVTAVRQYSDFVGKMFSYPDGKKQQMRDKILRTYDPNQYPDSIPSMTARYGSAEWMTWLDVFDVKETVRTIFSAQNTNLD
jgi:2-polyprenyl-6-methoxyphenol hydroxylase-like FAD-dependent oxidoreductase